MVLEKDFMKLLDVSDNTRAEEIRAIRKKLGMSVRVFAEKIGAKESTVHNWIYGGSAMVPLESIEKARVLAGDQVGSPLIPIINPMVPIPFIGAVAASSPVDWTNPLESDDLEFVPNEMAELRKDGNGKFIGRFACKVVGDSMIPLLYPDDLLVFESSNVPKIGVVVLHRSDDKTITVKTLKHNGTEFLLQALNPAYESVPARGLVIGHLVGVVRQQGSRRTTEYDPSGIRP
jgi:SOS-response transcriptional repressor LexA